MEDGQITVKRVTKLTCWSRTWRRRRLSTALASRRCSPQGLGRISRRPFEEGTAVKGRVAERIKGGLRVDIDGIAAFLPGSQVDVGRCATSIRCGREIEAKVIKLKRKRSNVVLS